VLSELTPPRDLLSITIKGSWGRWAVWSHGRAAGAFRRMPRI